MAAFLAAMPIAVSEASGRTYGSLALSSGYDSSILNDASSVDDAFYQVAAGLGWRGRVGKGARANAFGLLSHMGFIQNTEESRQRAEIELGMAKRLTESIGVSLEGNGEAYFQPGISQLNYRQARLSPGVSLQPLIGTRLDLTYRPGIESYPNDDLDFSASAVEAGLTQDLGLIFQINARIRHSVMDFSERRLYCDELGTLSDELRQDTEKNAIGGLRAEWLRGIAAAGYAWRRLSSNGNYLDYGPDQVEDENTISGDERLVQDYYSYTSQGPVIELRYFLPRKLALRASHRWYDLRFDHRIAKDESDLFRDGDPLRTDRRRALALEIEILLRDRSIELRWQRETSSSNDALYDFTRDQLGLTYRLRF